VELSFIRLGIQLQISRTDPGPKAQALWRLGAFNNASSLPTQGWGRGEGTRPAGGSLLCFPGTRNGFLWVFFSTWLALPVVHTDGNLRGGESSSPCRTHRPFLTRRQPRPALSPQRHTGPFQVSLCGSCYHFSSVRTNSDQNDNEASLPDLSCSDFSLRGAIFHSCPGLPLR
jgi:hypothetical protein